jgi:hypothetical protein
MDPINKTALRAAMLIHEQVAGGPRHDLPLYLPDYLWTNIQRIRRQIDKARRRGWHGAAKRLTEDLTRELDSCSRMLGNACRALQSCPSEPHLSSASDIYRDILALYDEFEDVKIDIGEHELSVTTDRIVLEDIGLGRFDIRLDWQHLGKSQPYRVVALDPNPAAKDEEVTHPHVQSEQLCEGEGRSGIQAALAECRLYDFFILVSQVLHTYGRGSSYIELEHWAGVPCEDCGGLVDEDGRYYCRHCDKTLCGSCSMTCNGCQESFCSECISTCAACGEEYCGSCLQTCPVCHQRFCENCREAGMCQSCHDKQQKEDAEDDPTSKTTNEKPTSRSRKGRQRRLAGVPA